MEEVVARKPKWLNNLTQKQPECIKCKICNNLPITMASATFLKLQDIKERSGHA